MKPDCNNRKYRVEFKLRIINKCNNHLNKKCIF